MLLRFPKAVLLSVLLLLGSQISSLTILSQEVEPSSPVTNTAELPSSSLPEPYSLVEPFVSSSGESIVEPSEDSSSSELSTEPSLTEPSSTPKPSSPSSTNPSSSEPSEAKEETEEETESSGSQPIYRLYNPGTGKHLYTTDDNERKVLYEQHGWGYEGIGWFAPRKGVAVYRLYNPGLKNHLYTTDTNEVRVLTSHHGWKADNNGRPVFYSGGTVSIYRLYNARLSGRHHWTTDTNEYNVLPRHGWKQEGVKFLATQVGKPIRTQYYIFEMMSKNGAFVFSSGAGAWRTGLNINPDGTFSGQFSDADAADRAWAYPKGSVYISDFRGKFSKIKKVSPYEYHFILESLDYPAKNQRTIKNGIQFITSTPIGLGNQAGQIFYLYLPGRPVSDIPKSISSWIYDFKNVMPYTFTKYVLVNGKEHATFVGGYSSYTPYTYGRQ